ncbi:hypothetical protein LEMLEM_LOCUS2279, partial [Lemmus lemmus]
DAWLDSPLSIYQGNPWGHKSLSCPAGRAHIPIADSVSNLPALVGVQPGYPGAACVRCKILMNLEE